MKRFSLLVRFISLAAIVLAGLSIWYFFIYEEEHWLAISREDFRKLERLAKAGNGEACFCLSQYYLKIPEKHDYWLMKAAIYGDSQAQLIMFTVLKSDAKTVGQAIEFLKQSAQQNNAYAQLELGREYQAGEVMPRDPKQAEYWYRRTIQNGAKIALYDLAKLLTETRKDRKGLVEAYELLDMEEERANPRQKGYLSLINGQKTIIIKKALDLGYNSKSLIRQAASMAAIEKKNFTQREPFVELDERCRKLADSKTITEKGTRHAGRLTALK